MTASIATHDEQNVRMFLTSHLYGPLIGLALAVFLLLLGFPADYRLFGFTALVCLFWAYRFALGRAPYVLLSLFSLQHLCFVIMWASHGYGGLGSPFLLWLAVVPLLAFLYLSPNVRLWAALTAMIAANAAGLWLVALFESPPPVDEEALDWLALVSLVCAAVYVSMMALHFSRLINSRDAVEKEAARHRQAAAALDRLAADLRRMSAAKDATVARIGKEARAPLIEIAAACEALRKTGGEGIGAADLRSIAEAVRYLQELVRDTERYARLGGEGERPRIVPCDLEGLLRTVATEVKAWPKSPPLTTETTEPARISTDPALLSEAVLQVLRHLGQPAFNRPLTLRGTRLPAEAGDYIVIDVFKERNRDAMPPAPESATPRQPRYYGSGFALALASRLLSVLGGTVRCEVRSGDGAHARIEVSPLAA